MSLRLLTSSWVVTAAGPPLRDGCVGVRDGRVAWVGPRTEAPAGDIDDLGFGVLLPGLVNAHCHLELSYLADLERGTSFVGWVEGLVAARAARDRSHIRPAAERALRDMRATGTVAVGDVSNALDHLDLIEAAGIRAAVFYELIGWDPARAEDVLGAALARMEALPMRHGIDVRLAAHAPHSVSPALFRALARRGGPAALHLAESEAESRFLSGGDAEWQAFLAGRGLGHVAFAPPGVSPVRHVDGLGVLHPRLVAAHCVRVDAADRELLRRRGVHAVLCPRSNRELGNALPPLPDLLADGVGLAVGTDSLASVASLDLMEDLRLLRRAYPAVPAETLVTMATRGGAEALGFADLGTIEAGKAAAFAYAPAARPPEDPFSFLLSEDARVRGVA